MSSSSIGSLEAVDRVEEDFNRAENSRATGFMGKSSEVTWMQCLRKEAEYLFQGLPWSLEPGQSNQQDGDVALYSVNYHLDDIEVSVPGPVETYGTPPRENADQLFQIYLQLCTSSSP